MPNTRLTATPWIAEPIASRFDEFGNSVAQFEVRNAGGDLIVDSADAADARLIAAAPDMLAELKRVGRMIWEYTHHKPVEMCAFAEADLRIQGLIALAKGGAA